MCRLCLVMAATVVGALYLLIPPTKHDPGVRGGIQNTAGMPAERRPTASRGEGDRSFRGATGSPLSGPQ